MRNARTLAVAVALVLAAPVRGQEALTPLAYDWTSDGIVTAASFASTITLLLLKDQLAPVPCRWCVPGTIDGNLAKSVAWSSTGTANTISDVTQLLVPAGMMGFGLIQAYRLHDPLAGWSDVLLITEATSIAMLVNTVVKYATGRARPYAWLDQTGIPNTSPDTNLSFFSGHVTFAFAVAASAGTLFLMQGMPGAGWALGAGLAVAAFTGYLRMAAEQHYLSDVLTGAAIGGLVGWAVPYVFHRPRKPGEAPPAGALVPAPGGIALIW